MRILLSKISIEKVLITLFMVAYFIPNFYATDRIGNQWLFLSIIALATFIYLVVTKKFNLTLYIKNYGIVFYFIFIVWSFFTIFFAFNKAEALVTFNQYFTIFISYLLIKNLCNSIKNADVYILYLLITCLFFEVYLSFSPIIEDINNKTLTFRSMRYSGAAANINITAFSLIFKLPLLMFFSKKTQKTWIKLLSSIIIFLILLIISLLGTRGAFLAIAIITTVYIGYELFSKSNFLIKLKQLSFYLIPLLLAILVNLKLTENQQNNVVSRASTISLDTNDGSVNQRLRYYKHAFSQFMKSPIIGVGIGNWKFTSIDYDKNNINGYIIPYHAHNDFLQVLAEQGLFGAIFYILFFYFSSKSLLKKDLFKNPLKIFLFCSLIAYVIDSLLNFPISRPISQLFLIFLLTLISINEKKPSI